MKFVHPEILYALSALAIPVIVHLFNFRRFKKVLFSNVEFLKEIKLETQNKSKLKHLLILLSRILAMAGIILAFAQPYIPSGNQTKRPGDRAVSIYLDNSFSMDGENQGGRLLDIARNKAIEIVNSYPPTDKFQLLTNDFEGRHQRLVSKEEMVDLIQEVHTSPATKKTSEVLSRQLDLLNNSGFENKISFILSDLQASVTNISELPNDTSVQVRFVPTIASAQENIFIDSVWFDTPVRQLNQPEILHISITNTGEESRENVPLQLSINGQSRSVATFTVAAKQKIITDINFTNTDSGFKNAVLSIQDHPIVFDDKFFFSYNVARQIAVMNICAISAAMDPVNAVFSDDPYFKLTPVPENAIDFGAFSRQHLIILNQLKSISSGLISELEKFVSNGGSVFIIPSPEADLISYNELTKRLGIGKLAPKVTAPTKVNQVNYRHYIYVNTFEKNDPENIDLPKVNSFFPIELEQRNIADPMMTLQNGMPFLVSASYNSGRVYLSSVSLLPEESDFTHHAFFPTTLIRCAIFSQPATSLYYTLGGEQVVTLRNVSLSGEETFKLKNVDTGAELIPEHRNAGGNTELFIHHEIETAGNFLLSTGDTVVAALSFNYDRRESQTKTTDIEDMKSSIEAMGWNNISILESGLDSIGKYATALDEGKKYWYAMIIFSLIFLAIEILLIKFWR
ncbi:MAG: BatA domain-containing protein [Crocinitomicaceae bacterium]|nr:BatA domain-containing protein [Crocinitomicaceae bacterium]